MGRKVASLILMFFLIFGSFVFFSFVENCKAVTRHVGAGQTYSTIQSAINAASNGDTVYVHNGIYYENIVVNKSITLQGEDKDITVIDGDESDDVVRISADWVNISGFTIQNCGDMYYAYSDISITSNYNNITNNTIQNDNYGLVGIYLYYCTENNIVENEFINDSILIEGNDLSNFIHAIENNTVNGKPLYYYKNEDSNFTVPSDAGEIILVNCTNFTVRDENIYNVTTGIEICYSQNITVTNNSIIDSFCSLIFFCSNYSNVSFNNISSNNFNFVGLLSSYSNYNLILENNISNSLYGFFISYYCENNTIIENEFRNNYFGLGLAYSNNNTIYNNNFINNSVHAADDGSNFWYNATFSEGNYWDDYNCTDSDHNGIGDMPYDITGGGANQDLYPLMYERTSPPTFIWVDDNFDSSSLGWGEDHFDAIQKGVDNITENGRIYVFNGTYYENVLINKTISLFGENSDTTIINGSGTGDVVNIYADGVNISGFKIQNSGEDWFEDAGIEINSNYTTITGNIISNNNYGVLSKNFSFKYNNISRNEIISNNNSGIRFWFYPNNNTISYNSIISNCMYGISIEVSDTNYISYNNIISNTYKGLVVSDSYTNIIAYNNVSNTSEEGIWFVNINGNNSVIQNTISNASIGINIDNNESFDNSIYHNNFVNNTQNAYDEGNNTWDDGYPSGGNFWDDFDEPSEGAYDNNSDGIVDTPYNISGDSNQDLYPLTGLWGERSYQPTLVQPSDGATGVSTSLTLQVLVSDPNNDTMNVSFYESPGGAPIGTDTNVGNGDNASVTWSDLSYSTSYSWYAVANDSIYLTKSDTWSFTTESGGGGGSTPGPGPSGDTTPPTTPTNVRCTTPEADNTPTFSWNASTDASGISGYYVKIDTGANTWVGNVTTWASTATVSDGTHAFYVKAKDASTNGNNGSYGSCAFIINTTMIGNPPVADADGPYHGLTYENITFNGSNSHDNGTIVNYAWDFGDGAFGYGVKPTHRYSVSGLFNVTLTVTDNDGLSNTGKTTANITLDSDGDGWSDLEEETYKTNKTNTNDYPTDTDGDRIPDDFDEDDDNDGLPDYLETTLNLDPKDGSDVISLEIDGTTYYLIDPNKDGVSDELYTPVGRRTTVGFTDDGKYLIDTDGDQKWNYIYDPASKDIIVYMEKKSPEEFPWIFIAFGVIGAVILIFIILYAAGFRLWIEKPPNE